MPETRRLGTQAGASKSLSEKGYMTVEEVIAQMDEAGIDKMCLSAWSRPGKWVISNDDIYEIVKAHPERFFGLAAVPLDKPVEAVRELRRAVKELGCKGLRVIPWLWELPPNHKFYYPHLEAC